MQILNIPVTPETLAAHIQQGEAQLEEIAKAEKSMAEYLEALQGARNRMDRAVLENTLPNPLVDAIVALARVHNDLVERHCRFMLDSLKADRARVEEVLAGLRNMIIQMPQGKKQ